MSAFLTELPEDENYNWRIHVKFDNDRTLNGHKTGASPWYINLTDAEVKEIIKAYYDHQNVDAPCPACGKDPMADQTPYHWEHEPMDQYPKDD